MLDGGLIDRTIDGLQSRNMDAIYAESAVAARERALELIERPATVITGGSKTLADLGLVELLRADPKIEYTNDLVRDAADPVERLARRRESVGSDYVLGSVNALVTDGRIVNVDGSGSRIASYAYSAGKVILIVGVNKVCHTLDEALLRVRRVAAIRVAARGSDQLMAPCGKDGICREELCRPPVRECGKLMIIEKESIPRRITVILVGTQLGY